MQETLGRLSWQLEMKSKWVRVRRSAKRIEYIPDIGVMRTRVQ